MSTKIDDLLAQSDIDRGQGRFQDRRQTRILDRFQDRYQDRFLDLRLFLHGVQDKRHLLQPEQLAIRLNALDELDAIIGDLDPDELNTCPETCSAPELVARAYTLRSQFEAANELLYKAARAEIALRGNSPAMARWLTELANDGDEEGPRSGLSFDLLDELLYGVLQLRAPVHGSGEAGSLRSPEMTDYQPTPTRHILDLIAACNLSGDDLLVDLGSGLGHVPLLASILTGIRTVGVEVQPAYALSAQASARDLNLSGVQFAAEDARMTNLSDGTVFYLFSPFKGSILTDVLSRLRKEAAERPIKICSLGPCTCALKDQTWLLSDTPPDPGRIAVFKSL
jgi:Histone methylation protein DOT1